MVPTLLWILKASVMALILAIGMDSTLADLTHLLRRPVLLLRSLAAMYVAVPLVALLAVTVLKLPSAVVVALLVLAISAGAPLLPRKVMHLGDGAYIFSLVVTSSLLAIVTVPAWVAVLAPVLGRTGSLASGDVARVVVRSFLAPLLLGMLLRALAPRQIERIADRLILILGSVLTICALVLLATQWSLLADAGMPALLALGGMSLAGLAIGHLLGGPDPDDRTALAVACSTRHLGIAVLIATSLPGARTAALVLVYLVSSAVVTIPYLRWSRRVSGESAAH